MFYESERIVRKQLKYTKLKAYDVIRDLESKGLSDKEIISCINLLIKNGPSEFQVDVLNLALKTITLREETPCVKTEAFDSSYDFIDGRVQRKISPNTPITAQKRKTLRNNKN